MPAKTTQVLGMAFLIQQNTFNSFKLELNEAFYRTQLVYDLLRYKKTTFCR